MLRVVIADDEERICKLIQALAKWEQLGMTVVGTAGNGLEALDFIRDLSPDILITDIRMPGCGGLELISRAKELNPSLEVIIISGYAQFDYAQTAIQFGVGEYLLKPINQEALNNTLEKMGERCRARKQSETDIEYLRSSSRDDRERLRNNLIPDLLDGRYGAPDTQVLGQTYYFEGGCDTYQVFLLKMDYDVELFQEPSLMIVRNKAEDIFRPLLAEQCGDFVLGHRGAAIYGVMNYPVQRREILRGRLREGLNQLVALTSLFGPVVFSMALGRSVGSAEKLAISFENARGIIAERLLEGTSRLLEGALSSSDRQASNPLDKYVRDAARAVELLSVKDADAAVAALETMATAAVSVRGGELLALVKNAGAVFAARLGVENQPQVLTDFETRCEQCCTVRQLFDSLRKWQEDLLLGALERRQSQNGQPIRLAKQYIQKHFAQPLSLEEVSEAIGFSVNYFSTLFKKETGEGFNKYLTRVRMEEARNLLRETRLPVTEVCKRVGYMDIKHFTHVFKVMTGLTPGEFRKLYG